MKKRTWMKKGLSVICMISMLFALSACSSGSTSSGDDASKQESKDTSGEEASGVPKEISDTLSEVTGKPGFYAEEFGKVDAKVLSGKKIMLVAYDSTNDWCVNYVKMADALYKKAGASSEITYCDGTTDSWIQAIQSAVNQKYDAIDLFGISDIGQLESAIEEAKAAGVYVQDTHGTDISDTSSNTDCSIGCDYKRAGELMAMEAISEAGGTDKINCLVVADVGWGADTNVRDGITGVFDKYNCKYTMADVSITDWTEGIGNAVRNAFVADNSYNAVIAYYDNMCLYVIPALEELGLNLDDIVIGSFNGSPGLVDYIKEGKMDFDLGESTGWCACHAADCMARHFDGKDVHNDSGFAMYFIKQDNVDNYLDPSSGKASYACDGVQDVYLPGYSDLWGIKLDGVFDKIK